ncbi:MAG: OST-HTH/LOTUS domain-containing protein, partial [Polaromonas sp.]
ATSAQLKQDAKLVMLLRNAVQAAADDEGWARVGAVGTQIANQASFDHRNYGYATLTKLLMATQLFDIVDEGKSAVMVRDKRLSRPSRN